MVNVRELTFTALNAVLIKRQNSDEILARLSQRYNLLGNEKRLFYALTKGTIKRKIYLDFVIKSLVNRQIPSDINHQIKNLLRLGLYQIVYMNSIPNYASVNEVVKICNKKYSSRLCGFLNAVIRTFIRNGASIELPDDSVVHHLAIKFSFPQYMIEDWLNEYGEENTIKMCEYFNKPAHINLRFDPDKISYQKLAEHLREKKVGFSRGKFSSYIIKISNSFDFLSDSFFQKGYYYIQDESSVLPVMLLHPQVEDTILDICAAPGGKATLISALIHNKGKIIANDIDKKRITFFKENVKRMKCENIEFSEQNATNFMSEEKFDKILLDVPCTGWGAMQKKPEIRLQDRNRLKSLIPLQARILKNAAKLLKKGGIMVYCTCTLNKAENEWQIEKFLNIHNNFRLEKANTFVDKSLVTNGYIITYPFRHNIDGTFGARLKKVS